MKNCNRGKAVYTTLLESIALKLMLPRQGSIVTSSMISHMRLNCESDGQDTA